MSKLDHILEPETTAVHRLEVISGTGRRRRFSDEFKARVLEETLVPGSIVSQIARRHGVTPQQVFTWRRQARSASSGQNGAEVPMFVPAVIEDRAAGTTARAVAADRSARQRNVQRKDGFIEIEVGGSIVRVGRGADADTLVTVILALKRTT